MSNLESTKRYLLETASLVVPAERVLVYEVDSFGNPVAHISSTPNVHWGGLYRRFAAIDPFHPQRYRQVAGSVFGTAQGFQVERENPEYVAGFRSVLGVRYKADVFLRDGSGEIMAGIRYARFSGSSEFSPDEMQRLVTTQRLFSCTWQAALRDARRARLLASLTEREHEVLDSIVAGLPNEDIARKLGIALPTVKNHVKSILTKTDQPNRAALLGALLAAG